MQEENNKLKIDSDSKYQENNNLKKELRDLQEKLNENYSNFYKTNNMFRNYMKISKEGFEKLPNLLSDITKKENEIEELKKNVAALEKEWYFC